MWNILHLSAFLLVVPTIFYQCTDNASGTLRQFPELQQYLSESEEGGGGQCQLIIVFCSPGRERSNYWFNSRTVTTTDSPFYGNVISQIIGIFVGEWEGGRGQWPNYSVLPGRKRSKYWFNSRTVTTTDSPFYGKRFNPTEKEGLHQILYCVHTYAWYCISMQEDTA